MLDYNKIMRKFLKFNDFSNLELPEEKLNHFDRFRVRLNSPFKLRAPTPPRSRESSPKASIEFNKHQHRYSSLEPPNLFVLKVPFASVNCINQSQYLQKSGKKQKKNQKFRNNRKKHNRRSGSLEFFY